MQRVSPRFGWWVVFVVVVVLGGAASAARAEGDSGSSFKNRSPVLLLGVSRSTFDVGGYDEADPQPFWSPRLGLSYTAPRHAVWALEFGLWADNLGGEWKDGDRQLKRVDRAVAEPAYTHRLRLLYLGVPLMVRFSVPNPVLTPYVKAGIEPSLLLSARAQTRETATDILTKGFHDVRNECRKLQLSAVVGAGVRTDLAKHAFILEGYYLHGFDRVIKSQTVRPRGDLKTRSMQLYLGIGLRKERA